MTPAKLMALEEDRMLTLELLALPMDRIACLYANSNRDPGEKDANGNQVRPPAPIMKLEEFRTRYSRANSQKSSSSAAEDANWDPSLHGAKANVAAWRQWTEARMGAEFVKTKGD